MFSGNAIIILVFVGSAVFVFGLFAVIKGICTSVIMIEVKSQGAWLYYHGNDYRITDADIPGITESGVGKIVVKKTKWGQSMKSFGLKNISSVQTNKGLFINGVNIYELLKSLQLSASVEDGN